MGHGAPFFKASALGKSMAWSWMGGTLGMMLGRALLSSAGAEDVASQVSLGLINTLSGPWFTTIG